MGGLINVVIESGAIHSLINYSVYRLEDKSITVLVPSVVVLMAVIGGLAGQDSLVAFVAVGMVLARKLRLDRIAALGMFYLPYITGQAAGPTIAIILMAQETAGLPPVSGLGARLVVWCTLTLLCVLYTTRYCLRIHRNPSLSIAGEMEKPLPEEAESEKKAPTLGAKELVTVAAMFVPFAVYAYGAASSGWGFPELLAFAMLAVIVVGIVNRMNMNRLAVLFIAGATAMGGICLMIGFAKVIGMVLIEGKILHTIAYGAVSVIGSLGESLVACLPVGRRSDELRDACFGRACRRHVALGLQLRAVDPLRAALRTDDLRRGGRGAYDPAVDRLDLIRKTSLSGANPSGHPKAEFPSSRFGPAFSSGRFFFLLSPYAIFARKSLSATGVTTSQMSATGQRSGSTSVKVAPSK